LNCPRCESLEVNKYGFSYNSKGTNQVYKCKDCERKFSVFLDEENEVVVEVDPDEEIVAENVRLAKQKQKFQDKNRVERKSFREQARIENAVEEYSKELINILKENNIVKNTIRHESINDDSVAIFSIFDSHFNELVDLPSNKYSFSVASKRLKKMVIKSKEQFSLRNISTVLVTLGGDLMNSSRRLDELLSQATNRSKATFLAVQLLQQVISELNEDYNIVVTAVTGNESRMDDDIGWVDVITTDNFDWTIFNFLKFIFKESDSVTFKEPDTPLEDVINIGGKNILLLHGHQKGYSANPENGVTKSIRKYSSRGIRIDFVIFGHIHQALISETYARSGSLVGANAYSENSLQLTSRASQNIHIVSKDGIDSYKIDLQETGDIVGYDIDEHLEAYNAKSEDKCHVGKTIFEIVI